MILTHMYTASHCIACMAVYCVQVKARSENVSQEIALHEANVSKAANERKPLLQLAQNAVDSIDKAAVTELKVNSKPHALIEKCLMAVQILLHGEKTVNLHLNWETSRKMIAKVEIFIEQLMQFKPEFVQDATLTRLEPILSDTSMSYDKILAKSEVTAKLYTWVTNMSACATAYKHAKPLLDVLSKTRTTKDLIEKELLTVEAKVTQAIHTLADTQAAFLSATETKGQAETLCNHANTRLAICERLTRGFVNEKQIWSKQLDALLLHEQNIEGDVLVISSYITYTGSNRFATRQAILNDEWIPMLKRGGVHISKDLQLIDKQHKPSYFIDDGAYDNANIVCKPSAASLSVVNNADNTTTTGTIQAIQTRCTMLVDPHEIALKWLIEHEQNTSNYKLTAHDAKGNITTHQAGIVVVQACEQLPILCRVVTTAVETGSHLILSDCDLNTADCATIALYNLIKPLLQRELIERGSAKGIKDKFVCINGCEVTYNNRFRLRLHTQYNLIATPVFIDLLTLCSVIDCSITFDGLQAHLTTATSEVVTSDIETLWVDVSLLKAQSEQQARQLEDTLLLKLADAQSVILSESNSANNNTTNYSSDDSSTLINKIEELESVRDELHDINDEALRSTLPLLASTKKERNRYIDLTGEAADMYLNLLHNTSEDASVTIYSIDEYTHLFTSSMVMATAATAQQTVDNATLPVDESMAAVDISQQQQHDNEAVDDDNMDNAESIPLQNELHQFRLSLYKMMIRSIQPDKKIYTLDQLVFKLMYTGRLAIPGYTVQQIHQGLHYLYNISAEISDSDVSTAPALQDSSYTCPDSFPIPTWHRISNLQHLQCNSDFNRLTIDIQDESVSYIEYLNLDSAENESLPGIYKHLDRSPFSKLLLTAALRPDRITKAIAVFIAKALPRGSDYINMYSTLSSQEVLHEYIISQDCTPHKPINLVVQSNIELQLLQQAAVYANTSLVLVNAVSGTADADSLTMQAMLNDTAVAGHWLVLSMDSSNEQLHKWTQLHKQLVLNYKHSQPQVDGTEANVTITSSSNSIHRNYRFIVCTAECKAPSSSKIVSPARSSTTIACHLGSSESLKQALRDNMQFSRSRYHKSDGRTRVVIFTVTYLHIILYQRFKMVLDDEACSILDTHTLQHAIAVACTFMEGNSLKVMYTYCKQMQVLHITYTTMMQVLPLFEEYFMRSELMCAPIA
jgi:Microtubule-binding stalk of dynein motor/ATP-binding dynein motor region